MTVGFGLRASARGFARRVPTGGRLGFSSAREATVGPAVVTSPMAPLPARGALAGRFALATVVVFEVGDGMVAAELDETLVEGVGDHVMVVHARF